MDLQTEDLFGYLIREKVKNGKFHFDNRDLLISLSKYIHGVNCDLDDKKSIKCEIWNNLPEKAKSKLLNDGFFPYKGVEKVLYDNLPQKARQVFDKNGFCVVNQVVGSYIIESRSFKNEIEESIWQGLTPESRQSLLKSDILPINGIRKVEWEAIPVEVKKLLLESGFYPI